MTKKLYTAGLLLGAMCASFAANAARPSYTVLLQEINQLKDRVGELESRPITPIFVDSQGRLIGPVLARGSTAGATIGWTEATVGFSTNGLAFMLVGSTDFLYGNNIYFTGSNCSGEAFIQPSTITGNLLVLGGVYNSQVYVPDITNGSQVITYLSVAHDHPSRCTNETRTINGFPTSKTSIDISQFVPPFSIKLSP